MRGMLSAVLQARRIKRALTNLKPHGGLSRPGIRITAVPAVTYIGSRLDEMSSTEEENTVEPEESWESTIAKGGHED
jgi:hypothetical protein